MIARWWLDAPCDECGWRTSYRVRVEAGVMVLCAGCITSLRAQAETVRILRRGRGEGERG